MRKIRANYFVIKTNRPRVEVSWQVTGIRRDAYADAYRIAVEEDKPATERGTYLHPELFRSTADEGGRNGNEPGKAKLSRARKTLR
jgi:trimeric autotransporter adhesin